MGFWVSYIKSDKLNNLSFSTDTGFNDEPVGVLLHTPDTDETETHHHIMLSVDEAKELQDALSRFIREVQ